MDKDKKYNILQNLGYCLTAAWQVYPQLCVLAAGMIAVNCVVPLITAYLPKVLIVQKGTHDELRSEINGVYYELWNAQAQYYRNKA